MAIKRIEISEKDLEKVIGKKIKGCDDDDSTDGGAISIIENHIYFYADISPLTILKLNTFLTALLKEHLSEAAAKGKEPDPINLHINSPGGHASAGFLGYDTIMSIKQKVPVHTYIEGVAASAATFLSIAGTKRYITPTSSMVIHEVRAWLSGTSSKIMEEYKNLTKVKNKVEQLYLNHSNFKLEELQEFLKRDTLMTAEEALERQLVDEIKTSLF